MSEELQRKSIEKEEKISDKIERENEIKELTNLVGFHILDSEGYRVKIECKNCGVENVLKVKKGTHKDIIFEVEIKCGNCECKLEEIYDYRHRDCDY